jgi:hypothetical protein
LTDAGLFVLLHAFASEAAFLAGAMKMDERTFHVGADVLYSPALGVPDLTPITRAVIRHVSPEFADAEDALAVPPVELPA